MHSKKSYKDWISQHFTFFEKKNTMTGSSANFLSPEPNGQAFRVSEMIPKSGLCLHIHCILILIQMCPFFFRFRHPLTVTDMRSFASPFNGGYGSYVGAAGTPERYDLGQFFLWIWLPDLTRTEQNNHPPIFHLLLNNSLPFYTLLSLLITIAVHLLAAASENFFSKGLIKKT